MNDIEKGKQQIRELGKEAQEAIKGFSVLEEPETPLAKYAIPAGLVAIAVGAICLLTATQELN